jgi:hypothetical protein
MTDEHKAALAEGRSQGRAVRRYLEALDAHKPKRGRKRTSDSIKKRLAKIETELPEADRLKSLHLVQERIDLENELAGMDETVDLTALENDFVKAAGPYSQRRGISYAAWRALGVPPNVLKQAKISRSS